MDAQKVRETPPDSVSNAGADQGELREFTFDGGGGNRTRVR